MERKVTLALALLAALPILVAQSSPPAADDANQPQPGNIARPLSTYRDQTQSGVPTRLDYYNDQVPFVVFEIDVASSGKPAPSLDEEGQTLARLLDRLFSGQPRPPSRFRFATDTRALVAALDQRLLQPGANWDAKGGKPRHGFSGEVLRSELSEVLATSPIAAAFQAHGYRLTLDGISRVEFPARSAPAQVPWLISGMDITVRHTEAEHGATQ